MNHLSTLINIAGRASVQCSVHPCSEQPPSACLDESHRGTRARHATKVRECCAANDTSHHLMSTQLLNCICVRKRGFWFAPLLHCKVLFFSISLNLFLAMLTFRSTYHAVSLEILERSRTALRHLCCYGACSKGTTGSDFGSVFSTGGGAARAIKSMAF
jgi:hypothetical protein